MIARPLLLALAACAAALPACDSPRRYDAARDVHALLQAVQTEDRRTFDRHVDRKALRRQLRGQLGEAAAGAGIKGADVDSLLGGLAGDVILDQMIRPEAFRVALRRAGAPTDRIPSAVEIAGAVRILGRDRACLHDPRRPSDCLLTFQQQSGVWRLVAIDAARVRIAPGSGRKPREAEAAEG